MTQVGKYLSRSDNRKSLPTGYLRNDPCDMEVYAEYGLRPLPPDDVDR